MRLLLLEDVRKLGHLGDVVEVSAGYARNYLLPQRLATEPTELNIKAIEDRRRAASAERALRLKHYTDLVGQLKDVSVTIEAAANPEGTLYGSVSTKDIAVALQAQGYPIQPEHVMLDAPIRTVDNRMVTLEFAEEITAEIKVWVVREGATANVSDAGTADDAERDDDTDDDATDE
jgi:large subunit ribosomal protein L9